LKGCAVGSDWRYIYRLGLTSKVVLDRVYPAVERQGDKAEANCLDIMLCALFLLPVTQQKAWSLKRSCVACPQVHYMPVGKTGSRNFLLLAMRNVRGDSWLLGLISDIPVIG
jgi:hypothetical protein